MNLKQILTLSLLAAFIQGCTNISTPSDPVNAAAEQNSIELSEAEISEPEQHFPIETFYALLVAEFAGSRERYDIALGNYMQQAEKTLDPDIAARATHIARFLNARQAALTSALLWSEISPENTEARSIAASELIHSGRLLEATQYSHALLEQNSTPYYQTIATRAAAISESQRQQLITEYQQQLQQFPDSTELLVGLSLLHQQQRQLETALNFSRRALKLNPSLAPAAIIEAKLLNAQGKTTEALTRLEKLLQTQPENTHLRLQYARLLATTDLEKAQREFNLLAIQAPNDPNLMLALALINQERGQLDEAQQYFEKLIELDQHASTAHYYLGQIFAQKQQWQLAVEHFIRVEPGPSFMPALLQTTDILIQAGQLESAHKRLSAVKERFPAQANRFYLLEAETLSKHQHYSLALSTLDEALQQYPADTSLLYSRAMLSEQLNHLDVFEADMRAILKQEPNNVTALNALGYTLTDRTERHSEALKLITQALQLQPNEPAIIDSMGWVLYRLGNIEESINYLRQAMAALPDPEIAAHLGEVLWVNGQHQEAYAIWEKGLRLAPNSKMILDTINRLGASPNDTTNPTAEH